MKKKRINKSDRMKRYVSSFKSWVKDVKFYDRWVKLNNKKIFEEVNKKVLENISRETKRY